MLSYILRFSLPQIDTDNKEACSNQNYLGKKQLNKQITSVKYQTVREYYKKLKFNPPTKTTTNDDEDEDED